MLFGLYKFFKFCLAYPDELVVDDLTPRIGEIDFGIYWAKHFEPSFVPVRVDPIHTDQEDANVGPLRKALELGEVALRLLL